MRSRIALIVLLAFALTATAVPAIGSVIFFQPTNLATAYASQNDTATGGLGLFAQTFDNFTLATAANIGLVDWVGSYFNGSPSAIASFAVSFYSDASGAPGGLLDSFTITGNANETYIGTDDVGDPYYTYSAPVNFDASAGAQYWLSIVANIGFPPQWAWETGTGGDSAAYQFLIPDVGTTGATAVDQAFTLESVPEPFTLGLMGAGLAALGFVKFRRRRA